MFTERLDLDSISVAGGKGLGHATHLAPTHCPVGLLAIASHIVTLCWAVLGRQELLLARLNVTAVPRRLGSLPCTTLPEGMIQEKIPRMHYFAEPGNLPESY